MRVGGPFGFGGGGAGGLPSGATAGPDNAIARWDGVAAIQGSGVLLDDLDNIYFPNNTGYYFRNAANTAWLNWTWNDGADNISVGTTGGGSNPGLYLGAVNNVRLSVNSGQRLEASAAGVTVGFGATHELSVASGYIEHSPSGAAVSIAGEYRVPTSWYATTKYRLGAGSVGLIGCDASNNVYLGGAGPGGARPVRVIASAQTQLNLDIGGTNRFSCTSTLNEYDNSIHQFQVGGIDRFKITNTYVEHRTAGTGAATQGAFRTDKTWQLIRRNNANSGDNAALWWGSGTDDLIIGGTYGSTLRPSTIKINPESVLDCFIGSTRRFYVSSSSQQSNVTGSVSWLIGSVSQAQVNTYGFKVLRGVTLSDQTYTNADSPVSIPQGNVVFGFNTSGGAITATLPSASANAGQYICICDEASNFGTNNLTLYCASGDTIQNVDRSSATGTAYIFSRTDESMWLHSDGSSNWRLL